MSEVDASTLAGSLRELKKKWPMATLSTLSRTF
jgi:hypothetical protein